MNALSLAYDWSFNKVGDVRSSDSERGAWATDGESGADGMVRDTQDKAEVFSSDDGSALSRK